MIPHQPLRDVCPFLQWVARADIPPLEHKPLTRTGYQLTATFFHLAGTYRIRLSQETLEAFQAACNTPDNVLTQPPHIYFRCTDHPDRYLRFAWFGYAALLIGEL